MLVILAFFVVSCASTRKTVDPDIRILPSFVLSNWASMMSGWAVNRDYFLETPYRNIGLTFFRSSDDWTINGINSSTFAINVNGEDFSDAKQWEVEPRLSQTGVFSTDIKSYKRQELPFELTINYHFPPQENFLIVQYTLKNSKNDSSISGYLMDCAISNASSEYGHAKTLYQDYQGKPVFITDLSDSNQYYIASGSFDSNDATYYTGGADQKGWNVLDIFNQYKGKLPNYGDYIGPQTGYGLSYSFSLQPGEAKNFTFFKTMKRKSSDLETVLQRILSPKSPSVESFFQKGAQSYKDFLAKAKYPSKLNDDQMQLYKNSIIIMKNAQNPTVGTILASFHPSYQYKTWTRDGFFAALVMSELGYYEEGALYFRWMSQAELHDSNSMQLNSNSEDIHFNDKEPEDKTKKKNSQTYGFYTCYNGFTGKSSWFVDPQFDSAGEFLIGAYHIYLDKRTQKYLKQMETRIHQMEDFLISQISYNNLTLPDFSIWEENSDHRTKDALPRGYFAFTQGMVYAGLMSAAKLENQYFKNSSREQQLLQRAQQIQNGVISKFQVYSKDDGTPYIARQINSETLKVQEVVDSAALACVFMGVMDLKKDWANGHLKMSKRLLVDSRMPAGIGRFEDDIYFGQSVYSPGGVEVDKPTPPWAVTTAFYLWAQEQMEQGSNNELKDVVQKSQSKNGYDEGKNEQNQVLQKSQADWNSILKWMSDIAARNHLPIGEAVDAQHGGHVWSSAPDIYEHGGIFVWSALLAEGKCNPPNPMRWKADKLYAK
ncbi:MAG: putative Carbohydrate-binding family 6 protein [Streblomastix strix]|uniref:Putative Carbohydrate-binding family 6 protein n=1 Tax=Streblomastix strix TaxID=222440 RepID=A0A5J4W6L1_9EUKA|nr:MAG: putative Carbohydrate-binding family 6 protein [Streblomastix strix]